MTLCYIGLGGNFDQTLAAMRQVVKKLVELERVSHLEVSPLYKTTPVSEIPQPPYLNAVCRFICKLPLQGLWEEMQRIEIELGKAAKPKNAPRLIDLDLLFYGSTVYHSERLTIPHPNWDKRLFVLAPLAALTDTTPLDTNVKELLKHFSNPHNEQVVLCGTLT